MGVGGGVGVGVGDGDGLGVGVRVGVGIRVGVGVGQTSLSVRRSHGSSIGCVFVVDIIRKNDPVTMARRRRPRTDLFRIEYIYC